MSHANRTKCGVLQLKKKSIFIYEGINLVGRNRGAVVMLKDIEASTHHALIIITNDGHYISDFKSTNGTKLDGKRLQPYNLYSLENESQIEFTSKYTGTYYKLQEIRSQSSQLSITNYNDSQATQTQDGFYEASTQSDQVNIFNDDMDEDLSKILINTQVINNLLAGKQDVKKIDNVEEKNKKQEIKFDIHEAPTQLIATVPTINEAATQVGDVQISIVAEFAETQFLSENIHAIDEKAHLLASDEGLIDKSLNQTACASDSYETAAVLKVDNIDEIASSSLSKSVEVDNTNFDLDTQSKSIAQEVICTIENDVLTGTRADSDTTEVDEEMLNELKARGSYIADLSTQTIEPESQKSLGFKSRLLIQDESDSNDSSDCLLMTGCDSDWTVNQNSNIQETSKLDLSKTDTQAILIGNEKPHLTEEADLNASISQDESFLKTFKSIKNNIANWSTGNTLESSSLSKVNTEKNDVENVNTECIVLNTSKHINLEVKTTEDGLKREESEDIISDSDEEDSSNVLSLTPIKPPKTRRTRFVISDSESDGESNTVSKPTVTVPQNDSLSDYDESFIQRKSVGNLSVDCIPATQDGLFSKSSNESIKLVLSDIHELTELDNISAIHSDSPNKTNVAQEDDTQRIYVNETGEVSTEKGGKLLDEILQEKELCADPIIPAGDDTQSCDFFAPTQPVVANNSNTISTELIRVNSSDIIAETQDMCDFGVATQVLITSLQQNVSTLEDVDFLAPTQPLVQSKGRTLNGNDELFCMPTQSVSDFAKTKRNSGKIVNMNDSHSDDVDFDCLTQKLCDDIAEKNAEDDNIFDAATQQLQDARGNVNENSLEEDEIDCEADNQQLPNEVGQFKKSKGGIKRVRDNNDGDINFDSATQIITEIVGEVKGTISAIKADDINFEAETQLLCTAMDNQEKQTVSKLPEVESQLEVMFATQTIHLTETDALRPTNPMGRMLETTSTQDVLTSLQGTKRLSDDFEENLYAKRAKITAEVKTSRESNSQTTQSGVNPTTIPIITCTGLDTINITKDDDKSDVVEPKIVSKLAMKKRQTNIVEEESLNESIIECLADTIPMETNKTESNLTSIDDSSIRIRKKRLLDEESLALSPAPVVRPLGLSPKSKIDTKEVGNVGSKKSTATKRKHESKESKSKRKTRQSCAATFSDNSEETLLTEEKGTASSGPRPNSRAKKITNVSCDPEKALPVEETAETYGRRPSSRVKKTVDYNESGKKLKLTRGSKKESDDSNITNLKKEKSKKEHIINSKKEDASKNNSAAIDILTSSSTTTTEIKTKRGRPTRSKEVVEQSPAPQLQTPDRTKHITKPKIIFTMLDDLQLKNLVRSLGGSIVEKIESATVLVTSKVQRTLKLLAAIARSIPICSPEWLKECKKANAFLNPWDHLIKDEDAEMEWKFNLASSLRLSKEGKIFSGYTFILLITLSVDVIKGAIIENGGKVVARKTATGTLVVVAAPSQKSKYEPYLKKNEIVVSSEAILVAILRQELKFYDEYALN